jgi:hypothetical protein
MRAATFATVVVAAFVGIMYLRFASDSVPGPPSGSAVGGPQCVVFRDVTNGGDGKPAARCGAPYASGRGSGAPVIAVAPPLTPAASSESVSGRGTFVRVVNTGNTCLNIHSAPGLNAPIIDCAAEGVLLTLGIGNAQYPNVVDVDGSEWWSVITSSGIEGFASGEYLER